MNACVAAYAYDTRADHAAAAAAANMMRKYKSMGTATRATLPTSDTILAPCAANLTTIV